MPKSFVFVFVLTAVFIAVPLYACAALVINEIMYDLQGSDSGHEWVEIFNEGPEEVTLLGGKGGWRFNDGSNHILNEPSVEHGGQGSFIIFPGSFFILAADANQFLINHPGFAETVIDTVMSLRNTGATLSLIDSEGTVVNSVTYTSDRGAAGDGNSLQLINNQWSGDYPTPGKTNVLTEESVQLQESTTPQDTISQEKQSSQSPPSPSKQTLPITIELDIPQNISVGEDVVFKGSAHAGSLVLDQNPYYLWTFGDGTAQYGKEASHIYQKEGSYNVNLIVSFSGGTDSKMFLVTVSPKVTTYSTNITIPEQEDPIIVELPAENTDKKTPSKNGKITYTNEEKSVSIAPVSTSSAPAAIALAGVSKDASYPFYFGFAAILLIPLGALAFLGKSKKSEADEYEIIE